MIIKKFSKRERYIIAATVFVAGAAFAYGAILEPLAARRSRLDTETESKINALKRDEAIIAGRKALESEYASYLKLGGSAETEEAAVSGMLERLEEMSKNDSCLLANVKPVGTRQLKGYKEVSVEITVEADMEHLTKFLYDVEDPSGGLLEVKRFSISAKSSQSNILRGTFLVSKIILD